MQARSFWSAMFAGRSENIPPRWGAAARPRCPSYKHSTPTGLPASFWDAVGEPLGLPHERPFCNHLSKPATSNWAANAHAALNAPARYRPWNDSS